LFATEPVCAQAQNPRVTKGDAQKVVASISGDKVKTQTYCDIRKLSEQIDQAYQKNDNKMVDELSEKLDTLEKTLGPEYVALIDGLQDIDPENDKLGVEIMSILGALDRLCTRLVSKIRQIDGCSDSAIICGIPRPLQHGPFLLCYFSVAAKETTDSGTSPYREQHTRQPGQPQFPTVKLRTKPYYEHEYNTK
jgi:hypothetical protein